MGHYASEIDPNWGRKSEREIRTEQLQDKLADIKIGEFTVKELPSLCKLMAIGDRYFGQKPYQEDLDILDQALERINNARQP